jgi:hypothetical protein
MTPKQIKKVVENHQRVLDINSRVALSECCWIVEDLLEEEIKYLEETEPTATTTISEMKMAREVIRNLYHSIDDMDTNELVKEHIWDN